MIRPTDFASTAAWIRPASAPAARDGVDSTHWFHSDAAEATRAISGDLSPQARGLTADQHARRVLSYLQEDAA